MNPKVEKFFAKANQWKDEINLLRSIVLDSGLHEDFKWKVPCYTVENKNVAIIHGFKEYCALNFFKGALLKYPNGILIQQTENSQAARQIRFTSAKEIKELESVLKAYIKEAVEVEAAGLEVNYKKTEDFSIPAELSDKMNEDADFKSAFKGLTPGRQKGYLLYFSAAKQSETRKSRIEQYTDRILNGKGIRDCVCGQSKKCSNCDGSHKHLKYNH